MDPVSGAFAIVSLAIQLIGCVQKTSQSLRRVKNAPREIENLVETLDGLESITDQARLLIDQQNGLPSRPLGSQQVLINALKNCKARVQTLENLVESFKRSAGHERLLSRKWTSTKVVIKTEEVQGHLAGIRDATAQLQCAIMVNSAMSINEIRHRIDALNRTTDFVPSPSVDQIAPTSATSTPNDKLMSTSDTKRRRPYRVYSNSKIIYEGVLGIATSSRSTIHSRVRPGNTSQGTEENVVTLIPSFLHYALELRLAQSLGRITKSLTIRPVMDLRNMPIAKMCYAGDIQGLQNVFEQEMISPFVVDTLGFTLLHYAAEHFQRDLCAWLLDLGLDPDHRPKTGQTALDRVALIGVVDRDYAGDVSMHTERIVDTLRLLLERQRDFSDTDERIISHTYAGPVEGLELVFRHEYYENIRSQEEEDCFWFDALATLLRRFGEGSFQLRLPIRQLIRRVPDIQSSYYEYDQTFLGLPNQISGCASLIYGTLIDELFKLTTNPVDASYVGKLWLEILDAEGYDTLAYLEREVEAHARQQQFTRSEWVVTEYAVPRKLQFKLDGVGVSWNWWIDPDSSTFLIRTAFKEIAMSRWDLPYDSIGWRATWPFICPKWFDLAFRRHFPDLTRVWGHRLLEEDIRARSERTLRKRRAKAARRGGLKGSQIPGAWPV